MRPSRAPDPWSELSKVRVALSATTRCMQAIIRARNEHQLVKQVCAIVVDAGYKFCWVGVAENDADKSVTAVASAGDEAGYLSQIQVTWSDTELGRGPAGTAIRTGTTQIVHKAEDDSGFGPWREEARKRGFESVCCLPLMQDGSAFGVLCIYAGNAEAFGDSQVVLLTSLADSLAYGIRQLQERSEQLQKRDNLYRSQQIASMATEATDVGTWDWDFRTNHVQASEKSRALMGYAAGQEISYASFLASIHPADRHKALETIRKTMAGERTPHLEARVIRADGETRWLRLRGRPFFDDGGRPTRMLGVVADTTAQHAAEQENQRLIAVAQNSPDFIGIASPEGKVMFVNKSGQELVGIENDAEAAAKVIADFLFPEQWPLVVDEIMPALLSGRSWDGEVFYRHFRSGEAIPMEMRAFPIFDEESGLVAIANVSRDIRERKRRAEELRQAEEKFHTIFDNAVLGIFQSTPAGRYLSVNPAMAQMHGYSSPEEMIQAVSDIEGQEYVDPARRREFTRLMEEQGMVRNFECELLRKQGTRGWVSLNARAVRDSEGKILYYDGTQEDITERKRLEAQYEQAQKMEAVGRLAGGVAHDFSNILGVIMGYCELTMEAVDPSSTTGKNVVRMKEAASKAASLIRQLLAFSRQQVIHARVVALNKNVENTLEMLKRVVGEDVTVRFNAAPDLGMAKVDPAQVEQILMNLCVNARDAMPNGGRLTIETRNVLFDERVLHPEAAIKAGNYVMLAVEDTGKGIAEKDLPHIFEPFFTTKGPTKGTGLGLSTVYGIVQQNGGYISVSSEPDVGTTFRIYFPLVDEAESVQRPEPEAEVRGGSETILLVEDEGPLREVASSLLRSGGYHVLEVDSAVAAIKLVRSIPEKIDLVITDVIMPAMSGVELGKQVQELRRGIRVLYISGYAGEHLDNYVQFDSEVTLLAKPFTKAALLRTVRSVLDR